MTRGFLQRACYGAMHDCYGYGYGIRRFDPGSTWTWTLSALGGDWLLLLVPVALRLQTSFAAAVTPTKRCITASAHGSPKPAPSALPSAPPSHAPSIHSSSHAAPSPSHLPTAVLLPVSPVPSAVAVRCVDPGPGLELWPPGASYVPTLHSFSPRHCANSSSHEGRPRWCRLSTAAMCNVCSPP
jgi:hypothetical protein